MTEQSQTPNGNKFKIQVLKMVLGFFGGVVLLIWLPVAKMAGIDLGEGWTIAVVVAACSGFGLAVHGALKTPTGGP